MILRHFCTPLHTGQVVRGFVRWAALRMHRAVRRAPLSANGLSLRQGVLCHAGTSRPYRISVLCASREAVDAVLDRFEPVRAAFPGGEVSLVLQPCRTGAGTVRIVIDLRCDARARAVLAAFACEVAEFEDVRHVHWKTDPAPGRIAPMGSTAS